MHIMHQYIVLLLAVSLVPTQSQRVYSFKNWASLRDANWSNLLYEPSAFIVKSHVRLRNRPEGYQPNSRCSKYVGMAYLDHIRDSRQTLCAPARWVSQKKVSSSGKVGPAEPALTSSQSSVDCFTAPYVPVGAANKASISLCRSRNLVLNTCDFFAERRKGTLNKKFPMPNRSAVQLGCDMANYTQLAETSTELSWLKSIHHEVWWSNATRNDTAVARYCAAGSPTLVTTPTLFVMRDRHANYAHEMEVVSMAFSFLAALEPQDVASKGLQVVVVDQAPPTGFLETWARISRPRRLRILAHDPFPPNTCFRSAYHVYTFAAGIGYNTNGETASCESPVATGLSYWLRELYDERDLSTSAESQLSAPAAGARGMRAATSGIVMKNVVWLSRRNLEMVRLLLNASVGWKSMRLVRNEDEVVAGMVAAVQEWNSESCLVRRFERDVQKAYEESLHTVNAVHIGPKAESTDAAKMAMARRRAATESERARRPHHQRKMHMAADNGLINSDDSLEAGLGADPKLLSSLPSGQEVAPSDEGQEAALSNEEEGKALAGDGRQAALHGEAEEEDGELLMRHSGSSSSRRARSLLLAKTDGGSNIDEHGNDEDYEAEEQDAGALGGRAGSGSGAEEAELSAAARFKAGLKGLDSAKAIPMEALWADVKGLGSCRRTNVLFTFVDGDFNDMPYHQQLKTIFRTGVLVGVHGAGLTHGFFMPPGQSAVLQLLGESFAKVVANNVFRNMAVGLGNFYEDVLYTGVDVKVSALKQAVKRGMDFVAAQVMEAQTRQNGGTLPPLMLDDQSHFSLVVPSPLQCPRNRTEQRARRRKLEKDP